MSRQEVQLCGGGGEGGGMAAAYGSPAPSRRRTHQRDAVVCKAGLNDGHVLNVIPLEPAGEGGPQRVPGRQRDGPRQVFEVAHGGRVVVPMRKNIHVLVRAVTLQGRRGRATGPGHARAVCVQVHPRPQRVVYQHPAVPGGEALLAVGVIDVEGSRCRAGEVDGVTHAVQRAHGAMHVASFWRLWRPLCERVHQQLKLCVERGEAGSQIRAAVVNDLDGASGDGGLVAPLRLREGRHVGKMTVQH